MTEQPPHFQCLQPLTKEPCISAKESYISPQNSPTSVQKSPISVQTPHSRHLQKRRHVRHDSWHDSFTYAVWHVKGLMHLYDTTSDTTHSYVRHDSFIRATWLVTWLIHIRGLTRAAIKWLALVIGFMSRHCNTHCNILQQTRCNLLQPTATHCNTLQHTAIGLVTDWVAGLKWRSWL